MGEKKNKHTAIEKALSILNLFIPHNQEMTTVDVSQRLGYHRATTSRTMLLLVKQGFLEQNQQTKTFRLGPAIGILNLSLNRSLEDHVVRIAKPFLDRLRDSLKETVVLEVLSGRTTVRAYTAEGLRRIRTRGNIGDRLPMNAAAGAKAILAFTEPESWDFYLDAELPRTTPHTITDIQKIKQQLKEIRETGTSIDNGEFDEDINAIGAPIFDSYGKPIAAVVVAGLPSRIQNDLDPKMAQKIKTTAQQISKQLGMSRSPVK